MISVMVYRVQTAQFLIPPNDAGGVNSERRVNAVAAVYCRGLPIHFFIHNAAAYLLPPNRPRGFSDGSLPTIGVF